MTTTIPTEYTVRGFYINLEIFEVIDGTNEARTTMTRYLFKESCE